MRENQKEIEALTAALASGWDIEKADALASRLASRGGVRANLGRFGEALADLVRSVELFTRLVVDDGQDALEPKLALARLNRGISLCNTGRVEEGAADFEAAAAIYRRRIDECGEGDHRDMLETTTRNLQIAQQHIAQSRVRQGGAPMYDPAAVQPMREELTRLGVRELLTPEDVDATLGSNQGTALLVINSVCGCAAGGARPGVALALQNTTIPDELTTVFAGMERDAVDRAREHLDGLPPSSPPCSAAISKGASRETSRRPSRATSTSTARGRARRSRAKSSSNSNPFRRCAARKCRRFLANGVAT